MTAPPRSEIVADPLVDYARAVLAQGSNLDPATLVTRHFRLPFLDLDVLSTDAKYAGYCDRSLVDRAGATAQVVAAKVIVADATRPGIDLPKSWWEGDFVPTQIDARLAPAGLRCSYFHDDNLWHFYDMNAQRGVQLMTAPGAHPPWESTAPLRPFLHWIYAHMGMRMIHAGSVGRNGRGVLIGGHGGAGKSGTTLSGVLGGLDSAGDDYVLLDPRDTPTIHPVYRMMKQDEAGFRRLDLARYLPDPGPLNWQGKYTFDFEALGRGRRAGALAIEAIMIPRVAGEARSRLVPIRPVEAMLALAPSGIFQMPGEREAGTRLFADLVRRLPCYRIELGTDSEEIAATLAEFFEKQPL